MLGQGQWYKYCKWSCMSVHVILLNITFVDETKAIKSLNKIMKAIS